MSFNDVMKKAFPFLSAAASLGGPLGVMAAAAVGKAIGVDKVAPNADGIATAIATALADPQQRQALLQTEKDFQLQMAELGYKDSEAMAQVAEDDRNSARNREVQVKDWTPRLLAGIVVLASIFGEGYVLMHGVPKEVDGVIIGRILGTLDSALVLVLSYYFGSSAGSDRKTELLAEAPAVSHAK